MHSAQEIIAGLDCLTTYQHRCNGCPFNPVPGRVWVYGCIKGQRDAVEEATAIILEVSEKDGSIQGSCARSKPEAEGRT